DFARALGVPATICQGIEEKSKLYPNPHAFPVYYDGAAKAWRSFQGRKYKGIRQLTLFFFLPPLAPPPLARPTGGGSYWFPVQTTYDETGPMFANGYEGDWVKGEAKSAIRRYVGFLEHLRGKGPDELVREMRGE